MTFAVADGVPLEQVLTDWSARVAGELDAAHLFDLRAGMAPGVLELHVPAGEAPLLREQGSAPR